MPNDGVKIEPSPVVKSDDINKRYKVNESEILGVGGFATVVTGVRGGDGLEVAIKVFERENLKGKRYNMMCHEREILRFARHENIIRLHECVETCDKVYMVMDRMRTDLYEYIKANRTLSEDATSKIINQVLSGVSYLHDNSIVHRDIKPENILLNSPDSVCLADFGVAKILEAFTVNATPIGTSYYMAPEILRGIQLQGLVPRQTTREELKFIDLWSTGVVTYIALSGVPPFYGAVKTQEDRSILLKKIDNGVLFPSSRWLTVSDVAKGFISDLLNVETSARPTARRALEHPFITSGQSTQQSSYEPPKISKSDHTAHLNSLITTCDKALDPSSPRESDIPAVTTATTTPAPVAKPANPMKLRRARPKASPATPAQ